MTVTWSANHGRFHARLIGKFSASRQTKKAMPTNVLARFLKFISVYYSAWWTNRSCFQSARTHECRLLLILDSHFFFIVHCSYSGHWTVIISNKRTLYSTENCTMTVEISAGKNHEDHNLRTFFYIHYVKEQHSIHKLMYICIFHCICRYSDSLCGHSNIRFSLIALNWLRY